METIVGIPVGDSTYIVVKGGKVIRTGKACGALAARALLKPKRGETLYIKVGSE